MQTVLNDIVSKKDIRGTFICNEEGRVLTQRVPSNLEGTVEKVASHVRTHLTSEQEHTEFVFDKRQKVVARRLEKGCLVILCARNANISMVNMMANWAVKTLNRRKQLLSEASSERAFSDNGAEVDCLNVVIQAIEKMVDGVSKPGTFPKSFRESLVATADLYPFLDPFWGKLRYRDGILHISEPLTSQGQLVWGICDCLIRTLNLLASDISMLPFKVRQTQKQLMNQCGAQIEAFKVDKALFDRVFGGHRRDVS